MIVVTFSFAPPIALPTRGCVHTRIKESECALILSTATYDNSKRDNGDYQLPKTFVQQNVRRTCKIVRFRHISLHLIQQRMSAASEITLFCDSMPSSRDLLRFYAKSNSFVRSQDDRRASGGLCVCLARQFIRTLINAKVKHIYCKFVSLLSLALSLPPGKVVCLAQHKRKSRAERENQRRKTKTWRHLVEGYILSQPVDLCALTHTTTKWYGCGWHVVK